MPIENSKHITLISSLKNIAMFSVGSGRYQVAVKNKKQG
jgi:hypothetical protein